MQKALKDVCSNSVWTQQRSGKPEKFVRMTKDFPFRPGNKHGFHARNKIQTLTFGSQREFLGTATGEKHPSACATTKSNQCLIYNDEQGEHLRSVFFFPYTFLARGCAAMVRIAHCVPLLNNSFCSHVLALLASSAAISCRAAPQLTPQSSKWQTFPLGQGRCHLHGTLCLPGLGPESLTAPLQRPEAIWCEGSAFLGYSDKGLTRKNDEGWC